MGKKLVWALALSGVLFAAPAFATTLYVTNWTEFAPGSGCTVAQPCANPGNAIGLPDDQFVSLGHGGSITLDFGVAFTGPGKVWEVSPADLASLARNPETADIYTSLADDTFGGGGVQWTLQGSVSNALAQDGQPITILGNWRYLAVLDTAAPLSKSQNGFDVDAVSVTQVVPEPALLSLFGLGLVGMGRRLGRSRRRAA